MKLETLKDFEWNHDRNYVIRNQIKEEAIKWVKELEKYNEEDTIGWITHFFNITEEDLK